jgi:NAD(P)H-dependent FMN reductase
MLVMNLNGKSAIILHRHGALQETEFITGLLQKLSGNGLGFLKALHQTFHHKLPFTNNQNVVHMDQNNAAVVRRLEDARVWLMNFHVQIRFQNSCDCLVPQQTAISLPW